MDESGAFIKLLKKDRRFTRETYCFVNEALEFAQKSGLGKEAPNETPEDCEVEVEDVANHVVGQDLCRAAKDFAVLQYGFLARTVLARLGIRKTGDIGDVVYNMIEIGFMTKTDDDCREDFDDVFDLGEELDKAFAFHYEKKRRS